ncbi:MAG: hypothetical protein SPL10_06900 [Synergistales bacterium]|nr:hypothetical protein [Synergistales bacterium]MDY6400965.1 hypothetical protein [Synergistales bacterium]MDY6404879.1 hypothetical protein [Synergistales bacterium]MDY6411106.1 hypothetical protein [Synergistales bacterium]MDY6414866.1 hypothetical protein [Synergistales bacterium]
MGVNLNDAEYFADTISKRIGQLIDERNILRRELSRNSSGNLEQSKEFVRLFQENIISNAASAEKFERLEHILLMRY